MRINYLINQNSKYFLFLDVSFRQGVHHLTLATKRGKEFGLSKTERASHLALGVLKCIPGLGHLITLGDTLRQRASITQIKLKAIAPFERGKEHGLRLKDRIKEVYDPILTLKGKNETIRACARDFDAQIPYDLKQEMLGLAEGSGYSYEDVLLIHSFLDAQPGTYGCTSMAVKKGPEKIERIAAANHLVNSIRLSDKESVSRREAFLNVDFQSKKQFKKVLQASEKTDTIQSMAFNTKKGTIALSSGGGCAARGNFKTFEAHALFPNHTFFKGESEDKSTIMLFRNLDWPWYFLGQETVVLTRSLENGSHTTSVSWPGYIGTLSGMNSQGLALTENSCHNYLNKSAIPNTLLFTHILDNCSNLNEADDLIQKNLHSSSMNLMIVDKTSAKSYELLLKKHRCVGELS